MNDAEVVEAIEDVEVVEDVDQELSALFAEAGVRGFLYARDVDGPAAVGVSPDDPVCLASVFKIAVCLGYAVEAQAGRLSRTERLAVEQRFRDGGIGTSGFADPVELSLRDLALMMMSMSDNAATDVVLARVGLDRVNGLLAALGRTRTHLIGGCLELLGSLRAQLGAGTDEELEAAMAARAAAGTLMELDVCTPLRTTRSTARDTAELLAQIWRDEAGPAEACQEVRTIMGRQIWPHRLSSGFDDSWRVGAKTGTLPGWRNEAGVVEHADGGRYAVAVFTRCERPDFRNPAADRVIGQAAALAVGHLRSLSVRS
ncbi:serine hydrolase [Catenulispora sp. GP43]|uniref:serine hydrolase n=1 Tax=Catenulispora sp. GP43 TaxID=3156263 RepID=UPI003516F442